MSDHDIIKFVAEKTGTVASELSVNTTLFGDLGLDGDDAADFFDQFSKQFGVSLDGYRHNNHFKNEGMWPWEMFKIIGAYLRKSRGEDPHRIAGVEPITVARLVEAARSKSWRQHHNAV